MSAQGRLYIGGRSTEPAGVDAIDVRSAATEQVIGTVPAGRREDIDRAVSAVSAAREAFDHGPWPRFAPAERGAALGRLSAAVQARSEKLARPAEHGSDVLAAIGLDPVRDLGTVDLIFARQSRRNHGKSVQL